MLSRPLTALTPRPPPGCSPNAPSLWEGGDECGLEDNPVCGYEGDDDDFSGASSISCASPPLAGAFVAADAGLVAATSTPF